MRIWFFEIGEPLPQEGNVRLHRYGLFSRYLAKSGHQVRIWTSTFTHAPKKHVHDTDLQETFDGVDYTFLHGAGYARNVSLQRIRHNRHFAQRLAEELEALEASALPDVMFAPIPIIEVAYLITRFARKHNIPVIVDIRDEWPDEIVNIAPGFARHLVRLLFRESYEKMRSICADATAITGVSQHQVDYGLKFCTRETQHFAFPLGYPKVSIDAGVLAAETDLLRSTFDFTAFDTKCCFFGMMGRYFELESVIKAAAALPDIGFIIAGDGKQRPGLEEMAKGMSNVYLPGWVDQNKIQAIMSVCDIGLAPYQGSDAFSLPNKPFEYMSGGLAILSSVQGELKAVIADADIGVTLDEVTAATVEAGLRELTSDRDRLAQMKVRARQLFEAQYSSDQVFERTTNQIAAIVAGAPTTGSP